MNHGLCLSPNLPSLCLCVHHKPPADVSSKYQPQLPCCWLGLSLGPGFGGKFRKFVTPVASARGQSVTRCVSVVRGRPGTRQARLLNLDLF